MGLVKTVQAYCRLATAIMAKMPATNWIQRFGIREGWIRDSGVAVDAAILWISVTARLTWSATAGTTGSGIVVRLHPCGRKLENLWFDKGVLYTGPLIEPLVGYGI